MDKDKKAFLSAVAAAMKKYKVDNAVVIYTMGDLLHNTAVSLDQEPTETKLKFETLSDQLQEYFKTGANEQN